ncbi:MAG: ABC transporter permease [Bryobacteraceae bacterium]
MRFGFRAMRKSPGFTAVAILTLALGLGANTAIFSIADGVLLKPLPFPDAGQIVDVWEKPPNGKENGVSTLNYLDWARQNDVFKYTAAVTGAVVTLTGVGEPEQFKAQLVGARYFDLFGAAPSLGRTFAEGEDQAGKGNVVVLSNRTWKSRFGADRRVLGRTITLDNENYTIIGALPEDGVFDRSWPEVWMPLVFTPGNMTRNFHWMRVFARMKPGVTLEQARADMDAIGARIARDYPESNKGWGVTVERYVDEYVAPRLRDSLYVLLAAVAAVLLIGCANLANLLLARGAGREREVAIRSALGAGRARLVRQFLTETVLLSVCGGAAGLALGYGLLRGIQYAMPPGLLPAQADVRLDLRALLFLVSISLATGLFCGVAPAMEASRRDAAEALKEGGRGASSGVARKRLRGTLIVAEVALAFVLLTGAGLLIRSFVRLLNIDPGFEAANVLTMGLPMANDQNTDGGRLANYLAEILQRIDALPGVSGAAVTSALPLEGWGLGMWFQIAGQPQMAVATRPSCFFKIVSPSYFGALRMKLRRGRRLAMSDAAGAAPVTVINETMAKRYFKNEDPMGKRILIQQIVTGKHELGPEIPWEVVGVAADEKVNGLDDNSPGVYVSYRQSPVVGMTLLVRAGGDPRLMLKAIQHEVWQINKHQALTDVKLLEQIKSESLGANRLRTGLLGIFAGIALALAAIGIYGVISCTVAQRTHELGVRAALGASAMDLLKLAIGQGMLLVVLGLALGGAAALALTRLISSLLFNTSATDPVTMTGVAAILALVALAACYVPARRAARVDPLVALRYE